MILTASATNSSVTPSLITAGVAIIIFVIGKLIDSHIKRKERIINWYFKTIIEPTLPKIDSSLENLMTYFKDSRDKILNSNKESLIQIKSEIFGEYDSVIRNLSVELFSLVEISNPEIMEEIVTIVTDYDKFKELLDNSEYLESEDSLNQFKNSLTVDFKAKIYKVLYKPIIKKEKQWDNLDFDNFD